MARLRFIATPGLLLLAGLSLGCGESKPKVYPVSGTVTLDGKPLVQGLVYFKTLQTGVIESFPIEDGQFAGEAQPGDRRVEVTAYSEKAKQVDVGGMKGEVRESIIPARYNRDSKLKANVKADEANQYEFNLATK